jgi:hypothetical protein
MSVFSAVTPIPVYSLVQPLFPAVQSIAAIQAIQAVSLFTQLQNRHGMYSYEYAMERLIIKRRNI